MGDHHDFYECVLSLIPHLEIDQELNRPVIDRLVRSTNEANAFFFGKESEGKTTLGGFGLVNFPFYSFGNVKSYFHLEYRELVIFAIYRSLMSHEITFLDIGGNLGLHSLLVSKLPHKEILYFEPDNEHFSAAQYRFQLNNVSSSVVMHRVALSNYRGEGEFVRVLDNTTSSHLSNASRTPYGPLERTKVDVRRFSDYLNGQEQYLAKIDVEGTEAELLSDLSETHWNNLSCVVEITNELNAREIFRMTKRNHVNVFSQKTSWRKAKRVSDLPWRYDEGSVLLTRHLSRNDIFKSL